MSHQADEPKPEKKKRAKARSSKPRPTQDPEPQKWVSKYGIGRPKLYKPEYCDLLVEHMRQGKSLMTFGAQIYVGRSTIYDWLDKYPEFSDAYEAGKELCLEFWENLGRNQAAGIIPNPPEGANYKTVAGASRITAFMLAVHSQPRGKEDYGMFLKKAGDSEAPEKPSHTSVTFEYTDQKALPPPPDIEMTPEKPDADDPV